MVISLFCISVKSVNMLGLHLLKSAKSVNKSEAAKSVEMLIIQFGMSHLGPAGPGDLAVEIAGSKDR